MSEFKFACPVCGQHLTADSGTAGSQLECPTCFRKIVVPQAPASAELKLILTAAEAGKPRPRSTATPASTIRNQPKRTATAVFLISLFVVLACAGAAVYAFRGKIFGASAQSENGGQADSKTPAAVAVSNSVAWSLNPAEAMIPDLPAAGKISGEFVSCNCVTLSGGALGFRQLTRGLPDVSVTIYFFSKQPEDLREKKINIETNDSPAPRVTIRWMEGKEVRSQNYNSGYALKVKLGGISGDHIPGKIYLALPDADQTRIAGSFNAEIKKTNPPKPRESGV